ncbi:DNA-3-methyladenine glycosylase I [Escherichia coli]|nr:DNA-3-methyladenine glycosylase I [Escherichia coli]
MICLEGQQAGLSWITVLKKREKLSRMLSSVRSGESCRNAGRGCRKTGTGRRDYPPSWENSGIIGNARAYLQMEQNGEPFADFVWSFVNHQPQVTQATTLSEIPTSTPASDALSKALKKRGFKFVGTTICYSFMQACGLVNDHVVGCCCHPGNKP